MVKNKKILISYKLFFGLLGFSAIVTEIATLVERGKFIPVNFFSYFTIENNILISVVFLLSALAVAANYRSKSLDVLRALATVLILVVGVGFIALLSDIQGAAFTAVPWDNTVLHYIMPIAALLDLLMDRPAFMLSFGRSLLVLLYPIVYVVYSLVRGAMTGWYPYPFINPNIKGYGSVIITIFGLLVLGLVLIWCVTAISGGKAKKRVRA